jgi:hypothetical protein
MCLLLLCGRRAFHALPYQLLLTSGLRCIFFAVALVAGLYLPSTTASNINGLDFMDFKNKHEQDGLGLYDCQPRRRSPSTGTSLAPYHTNPYCTKNYANIGATDSVQVEIKSYSIIRSTPSLSTPQTLNVNNSTLTSHSSHCSISVGCSARVNLTERGAVALASLENN